jgi:hypothetical protein
VRPTERDARVWTRADYERYQRTGQWPEEQSPLTRVMVHEAREEQRARRNKYNVGPRHLRQLDGYTFDSIAERKRYEVLKLREKAGEIVELRVHPCWPLVVEDVPIGEYEADFAYRLVIDRSINPPGPLYVEDVKGVRTQVYQLKRKLMLACHGITVEEVEVT